MKILLTTLLLCHMVIAASSQVTSTSSGKLNPDKAVLQVEASCGQCKFGLPGKGCTLAVRYDGKAYFVDGAHIDSYGDAHASDGFCEAIRKAEVQGVVKDSLFVVSYFKLIDAVEKVPKE